MYDISNGSSFKSIRNWIKLIESNAQTNVFIVLVGNKCDKPERIITEGEGKKLANDLNMKFFEASSKTNQNVNEIFDYLTREILKKNNIEIKDKKNKKKSKNKNEGEKQKKNSDTKEIDFNKIFNLELYKFLKY